MIRLATLAALSTLVAVPLHADDPAKAFAPDFGVTTPFYALGNSINVTYYGWEGTTEFGHTLWAFSAADYQENLANQCFWSLPGGSCGGIQGTAVATKAFGASESPYLPGGSLGPLTRDIAWTAGTEIIFAIAVDQGDMFNWFFSGDPSRNSDGLGHVGYFSPANFPDGVPGNLGIGVVPQTAGLALYGFEDVTYHASDWDFDNLIFAVDEGVSVPTETVPEPATLVLLGTGASALTAVRRRRRPRPA